jgi:hypothetical protein
MRHYRLGQGKWVFIDWMGIEPGYGTAWGGAISEGFCVPRGIALRAHRPRVEPAPVIWPEHPWEAGGISPYATFLEDSGRFRCWYECEGAGESGIAYAESDDGVHWTKIPLGQKVIGGENSNMLSLWAHGHGIFIDPVAPPAERYKLIRCYWGDPVRAIVGAVSPDGLAWERIPDEQPVLAGNNADTQNVGLYDEDLGRYVIYTRQRDGMMQRRGINRAVSAEFRHFPPSEPVFETNPLDPPDWDYYSSGYSKWPGAVDAHVMRVSVYQHTPDLVNVHLAVSRDGVIWHRPLGREPWVDNGPYCPYPSIYASASILRTAPGEWSTYLGVSPSGHNEATLQPGVLLRAVSREDGFMSLSSEGRGEFWTVPFPLTAGRIRLNARVAYSGFIRAEVLAAGSGDTGTAVTVGQPIAGFTLTDCAAVTGDGIDLPLEWTGDLRALQGREVRLRFELYKAELFAVTFHAG